VNNTNRATKKQQELLEYVAGFIHEHGYGPSYREIMNAIGYKSVSTVAIHINGLITKGYLRRKDNSPRSLEVITIKSDPAPQNISSKQTIVAAFETALRDNAEYTARDTLLEALSLLGYETDAKRLKDTYEKNS
jgi:SOS-response transcriptional repressor LexA